MSDAAREWVLCCEAGAMAGLALLAVYALAEWVWRREES